ncbi:venom serine protease-like [Aedes aegypti]|uniref:Peptidase S1 domain-containing protein n=1 Tax=Aedes aegypti TaxID=7159 RepID=A0A903VNZ5_AEDAE|nr:venom serine protease-like [Aedes aegypti]
MGKITPVCDYTYSYSSTQWATSNHPSGVTSTPLERTAGSRFRLHRGHYLYAQCYDMYLPATYGCYYDKLLVSLTGDSTLSGSQIYCGSTPFDVASNGNKLVVALQTSQSMNGGGRFRCQITAIPVKCNCGSRKTPLIVGGQRTQANEFPMMSAIIDLSSKSLVCGATVITNRHGLTAAHCIVGRSITNSALLVGDQNMNSGSDTPYAKLMRISTFTVHGQYSASTKTNDIALVRTVDEIIFDAGVSRACLPYIYAGATFNNVYLEALGWGTLDFGGPQATELQKASLQVMNNSVQDSQICTYTPGKDSCQYDSGGPLLYTDPSGGTVYAIGVINYGITCASKYPSVSARVASYLSWIETNTGYDFCEKV